MVVLSLLVVFSMFAVSSATAQQDGNKIETKNQLPEVLQSIIAEQQEINKEQIKLIHEMGGRIEQQNILSQEMTQRIEQQDVLINEMRKTGLEQHTVNKHQDEKIVQMSKELDLNYQTRNKQISDISSSLKDIRLHTAPLMASTRHAADQNSTYGCFFDVLTMTCPADSTLFVAQGHYGHYAQECDNECCSPDLENDCLSSVQEVDPDTWLLVRIECNYNTQCAYQYQGAPNPGCGAVLADYMVIDYLCVSDSDNVAEGGEPVGFSAYVGYSNVWYSGDVIQFENIITNFGDHYDAGNYTFLCPEWGLYLFSVNILTYSSYSAQVQIVINGQTLVTAHADNGSGALNQASNTVVVECGPLDAVWVESTTTSYVQCNSNAHSTFSGTLISRL